MKRIVGHRNCNKDFSENYLKLNVINCANKGNNEICIIPSSTIAGTRYVSSISKIASELEIGTTLYFMRDKRNFFDEWAINICDRQGRRLGYLSCEHNEIVARLIDGGKYLTGKLVEKSQRSSWTKLDIKVMLND